MKQCPVCHRPIRYSFILYVWEEDAIVRTCSQTCMDWWTYMYPFPRKQLDRVELEAIEASLPEVGMVVAEIGQDKPVSAYTKDEILRLICTAYRAVEEHRVEIVAREAAPF